MEEKDLVIDTNVFIDHLRNVSSVVALFETLKDRERVHYSAITEVELLTGTANNDPIKRERLLRFLQRWNKIPVDNPLAMIAGDVSRKHNLSIPDAIIATTTITMNADLLTRDRKAFHKMSYFKVVEP